MAAIVWLYEKLHYAISGYWYEVIIPERRNGITAIQEGIA
jgi:hypothetical protein